MFLRRFFIASNRFIILSCLALCHGYQPSKGHGQVVVNQHRTLIVQAGYEEVLSRLDGLDATREMFASQDVSVKSYEPNKSKTSSSDLALAGATRAAIDITGHSCEFGSMCYLMSIVATEKQTTIDVELVQPVGMLRQQRYRFVVAPQGKKYTQITIAHELDILLVKRRLELVNRVISEITHKKACEELHRLTGKMVESVLCIANRSQPKANPADLPNDDSHTEEVTDENPVVASGNSKAASNDQSISLNNPNDGSRFEHSNETLRPAETQATSGISSAAASTSNPSTSEAVSTPQESPDPAKIAESATQTTPSVATLEAHKFVEPNSVNVLGEAEPARISSKTEKGLNEDPKGTAKTDTSTKTQTPVLKVVIDGVTTSTGTMRIALFNTDDQFRSFDARKNEDQQGEAFRKAIVRVKNRGKLVYEFEDVPIGSYVIAAFHDQDGNKKLNASLIGLPSEPYGFSRDARGSFGAPNYQDAIIQFDVQNNSFNFRIK